MEDKTYSYKKMSHFRDILTKPHNEANNMLHIHNMKHYTDKQFNKDLKKWFNETNTIQNDKVNTIIENKINKYK